MRRRLRDVGSKITEALAGPVAAGSPAAGAPPVPSSTETATEQPPAPVLDVSEPAGASPEPSLQPDPLCADAVELARAVAQEYGEGQVGDYLGHEVDDDCVLTHSFATTQPGYVGWRWAVTVARAEGSDAVTVDEVVLLPGSGALVAPPWVPWSDRVRPGDLAPGELLPPAPDDPRIVPAYAEVGDAEADDFGDALHWQLGLGRPRVLSREGRTLAAERWYEGAPGPRAPIARAAPAPCGDCGFLATLAGALGQAFGLCANELAPDDGRVVSLDHGCGAHSEVIAEPAHSVIAGMAVEQDDLELVATGAAADAAAAADFEAAEQLGHS
ncbi:MAG TPA: DUF3027 domain-containing protein [Mycobacteriales bacterium]|nr:DUF3027 domain-containing protein [Mycobacteriales bacterium]